MKVNQEIFRSDLLDLESGEMAAGKPLWITIGILIRKALIAATGLAPVRSGLKDRALDLLCIRGQKAEQGGLAPQSADAE